MVEAVGGDPDNADEFLICDSCRLPATLLVAEGHEEMENVIWCCFSAGCENFSKAIVVCKCK